MLHFKPRQLLLYRSQIFLQSNNFLFHAEDFVFPGLDNHLPFQQSNFFTEQIPLPLQFLYSGGGMLIMEHNLFFFVFLQTK